MANDDNRRDPRLEIRLEVELQIDGKSASMHTRDLSNKGVYLLANSPQLPAIGSIVYVRLKQALQDGEPPLVKARVVRADADGFALQFIDD